MYPRSEPRIAKETPVRVFGLDSAGRPFNQVATAQDVSSHGARLAGMKSLPKAGEIVGLREGGEKARYRVVWVVRPGTPQEKQIGLFCVEQGKYIWDIAPPEVEFTNAPEARLQSTLLRMPSASGGNRRRELRVDANGGAQVRAIGTRWPLWTVLYDLSMSGCYLETPTPFEAGTRLELNLHAAGLQFQARGEVTARHPLVGMAVQFTDLTPLNKQRLEQAMAILAEPAVKA